MDDRVDRAAPAVALSPERGVARHPGAVLAATILASSLSFIDGSVVNVGLPAIQESLGGGAASLQWIVDAYLLPLSALVLLGGALGDRAGRRRLLVAGLVLFALASAACAAATTLALLVTARMVQGVGAALLMPNSLAILSETFSGAARGRAIGTWAAVGAATSGLGPPLGGWLIDHVGWRSVFVVNLPVAATALILALRFVPARGGEGERPLDVGGGLLATVGLGAISCGLIAGSGPAGWTRDAWVAVGGGIAGLVGFVAWERRRGAEAMMPMALFASHAFVGLTLLTLLLYGALGAFVVVLPYGLMRAGGASAATAGAALLPTTLALAVLSRPIGRLAGRGGARMPLTAGCVLVGIGLLLLLRVDVQSRYAITLLPALALIGIGLAAAVAPLTTAVLASVEPRFSGTASGFNSAVARTGGLMATACLGGVLGTEGEALVRAGHATAAVAAVACFAAALCARLLPSERAPR